MNIQSTAPGAPLEKADWSRFAIIALPPLLVFTVAFLLTAWQCDDAYITHRTVENLLNGQGLRWQTAERVQSFTHPLWLFVLLPFRLVTGEPYDSGLLISFLLSAVVVLLILRMTWPNFLYGYVLIASAILSQAFLDYSSSGLENPLSHLLSVLIVYCAMRPDEAGFRPWVLFLLVGLSALNRIDSVLLYTPLLLFSLARSPSVRTLILCTLALAPLIAWEIFSVVYYGFPFPNTAYAKAFAAGVPELDRAGMALDYFTATLSADPLTLILMWGVILTALITRKANAVALAIGLILYQLYLFRIGGDFMRGRFFSLPLAVSLALAASFGPPRSQNAAVAPLLALLLFSVVYTNPYERFMPDFGHDRGAREFVTEKGIADERAFYYPVMGLLSRSRTSEGFHSHPWYQLGEAIGNSRASVATVHAAGFVAFGLKDDQYAIDLFALNDPLLARLPAVDRGHWRPGHLYRTVPEGYVETLMEGSNQIDDPSLAEFYELLRIVTRGDLWSRERWQAIWALNTGASSRLIDRERYRHPDVRTLPPLSRHFKEGMLPSHPKPIETFGDRLVIHLEPSLSGRELVIRAYQGAPFSVEFRNGPQLLLEIESEGTLEPDAGRYVHRIDPPAEIVDKECDRLILKSLGPAYLQRRILKPGTFGDLIESIDLEG